MHDNNIENFVEKSLTVEMDGNTCRICLEESDRVDLIAPCNCRGGSKYVHRECLDRWRYTREDRAFSKCTECLKEYTLIPRHRDSIQAARNRRIWFVICIARDIILGLIITQLIIICLAFITSKLDSSHALLNRLSPSQSPGTFYYICGTFLFFASVGIFSISYMCYTGDLNSRNIFDCCHRADYIPICVHSDGCGICCVEGGCCRCHACLSLSDCACCTGECTGCASCLPDGADCMPLLLIVLTFFAIVGVFMSFVAGMAYISRTVSRHMEVLYKKGLVGDFIVADLDPFYSDIGDKYASKSNGYTPLKSRPAVIFDGGDLEANQRDGGASAISGVDQRMLRNMGLL